MTTMADVTLENYAPAVAWWVARFARMRVFEIGFTIY